MSIKVLLADDHGVVRAGIRLLLESDRDLTVVGEATNGREAIREAARHRPDVVVLDIAMPELNGIDAAQQIRTEYPETQVVILSMYATREHIYRALQAGARGYILKESVGSELIEAIHAAYVGQRHLSRKISDMLIDDYLAQRTEQGMTNPLAQLSDRQREILQLVAEGKSSAEIAEMLALSPKTVETYRSRLMQKLGLTDLSSLIKFAIQHGLIALE